MTHLKFKKQLKMVLRDAKVPTRQEHLEITKLLAKKESYRNIGYDRISFAKFLSMQIRFIGWKIWGLQGIMLVVISCFLATSMGKYFMDNPRYVALLLCCLSILILMTALPFIHRAFQYKMHEIEAATRFSSVKLLIAKLLIIGIGDVLILICILCFAIFKTPLSLGGAMLYLLFPSLLACCGLLYLLGHIPATRFVVGSIGLCFLQFTVFSLLAGIFPAFYQQTFSISWAVVCLMLLFVCVIQFRQIIHRCSYAEIQLI